jgi:hypothetical protein
MAPAYSEVFHPWIRVEKKTDELKMLDVSGCDTIVKLYFGKLTPLQDPESKCE